MKYSVLLVLVCVVIIANTQPVTLSLGNVNGGFCYPQYCSSQHIEFYVDFYSNDTVEFFVYDPVNNQCNCTALNTYGQYSTVGIVNSFVASYRFGYPALNQANYCYGVINKGTAPTVVTFWMRTYCI